MKAADARVLLTGATGGIGAACAHRLVAQGAAVMLTGRSPARLAALARGLHAAHGRVEWHAADLSQPASLTSMAQAAARWRCNVLVHGAGTPAFGRVESFTPEAMEHILQMNLLAPMVLTQALLPHLRGLPHASVICIGSALGRLGLPGYSVYSASKFGLRGFAEALRRELGDGPVRVQYLGPRSTRTPFNSDAVGRYNAATGTAMDEPAVVAQALVQLLESGAAERFLGFPEKLAVRLNGLVPAMLDGAFARHRGSLPALP